MRILNNFFNCVAIAYIFYMVILAALDIGKIPSNTDPYEWWLPLLVFFAFGLPYVLGFAAGYTHRDTKEE